ncbi:MAG: molybdenum cofactor cytidylyltransferase [Acidobacteria bacterium]|nr:MAG: molybdenum cofactor cytidylyltransferase [Acidobacteriota bacterium]
MSHMISAIVLAAGKSERMGRPKALLPFRGRTFLENILDAIRQSPVQQTVVVVGHHREEIEPFVTPPTGMVFNPDYEQGMITSFQAGIRALPTETAGALLFLVDHPVVHSNTIGLLIGRLAPNRIILPTFEGRRGHPVLFGSSILQEILALTASQGANIVVRKDPSRLVQVPVNSPGILVDIDTPEDFQKLQNAYESR